MIVAESRYAAEDAAELVDVDLDPLPAVVDAEQAVLPGGTLVHEQLRTNLIGEFAIAKGDVEAALAPRAAQAAAALLPPPLQRRADGVPRRGQRATTGARIPLTIWSSTQVVHWVRREAAAMLGLPEARVRCVALDVGGGFGVKGHVYPEDLLIPFLARRIGRPVRWIEDRHEHLMCSCHSRDQIHEVEIGFDNDGRILGVSRPVHRRLRRVESDRHRRRLQHRGPSAGPLQGRQFRGRGADRLHQQGAERALSRRRPAGGELRHGARDGSHRRRARPGAGRGAAPEHDSLPTPMPYAIGHPLPRRRADRLRQRRLIPPGWRRRWTRSAASRHSGGASARRARRAAISASASAATSREPASGRSRARRCGSSRPARSMSPAAPVRKARAWRRSSPRSSPTPGRSIPTMSSISLADTAAIAMGFGTIASRSTVTLSAAIHHASERLREKVLRHRRQPARMRGRDLELRDGGVGIVGVPERRCRSARWRRRRARAGIMAARGHRCRASRRPITSSRRPSPGPMRRMPRSSRSISSTGAGEDREDTSSRMIAAWWSIRCWSRARSSAAPRKGSAARCSKRFAYDAEGQLLTGSLMDYLLPTASDMPDMQLVHLHSPSPLNPLGVKGVGEGGAIAPPVGNRQRGLRRAVAVQGRVQHDAGHCPSRSSRSRDDSARLEHPRRHSP